MRIERLGPDDVDRVAAAEALFDDAIDAETTRAFLADERHHLLVAFDGEAPAGFVTGVELLHPDKPGPEMFLYELGVDEAFRGRGIGRALVEALSGARLGARLLRDVGAHRRRQRGRDGDVSGGGRQPGARVGDVRLGSSGHGAATSLAVGSILTNARATNVPRRSRCRSERSCTRT